MTTTEKICRIMGQAPPNQDQETGLHYGVIPENDLNPDALDSIYHDGTDLGYESALGEFKALCEQVAKNISEDGDLSELLTGYHNNPEDEEVAAALQCELTSHLSWFDEYMDETEILSAAQVIMEECGEDQSISALTEVIREHFEDSFSDMMSDSCCESGPYRYEDDGYIIEQGGGGDLFIIKSPYFALCRECSPCAPNAGYLTSEGSMPAYCLGPEWFNDDEPPYDVFKVTDGSVVYKKE